MTNTQQHTLEDRLSRAWPPHAWCDSHVVLAVSAGPDSVALMRAMLAVKARCGGGGNLFVAHCHHALRGAAADADQAWLEALCGRLDLTLQAARLDPEAIAAAAGNGWEAAARHARYRFLRETAENLGARFVATAHTADDQVETVLHRILRGTGLKGLAGMPRHRPLSPCVTLIRPLLDVSRAEVVEYLSGIGQDYRIDESNQDTRWTRNRLRHELLPMLRRQYNLQVDEALLRLAALAAETHQAIAASARQLVGECVSLEWNAPSDANSAVVRIRIDGRRIANAPLPLVREVCRTAWQRAQWPLQAMGFDQWQKLAEFVTGGRDVPLTLPGRIRAWRENDVLVVECVGSDRLARE
jgi:tRNA(Ile)-lysidine synthase